MSSVEALIQFIARCDPAALPPEGSYVEREPSIVQRLSLGLKPSDSSRVLVLGQTGVGKTTELHRLEEALSSDYAVIRPPIDAVLDLDEIGWHDVMLFAVLWEMERRSLQPSNEYQKIKEALEPRREVTVERRIPGELAQLEQSIRATVDPPQGMFTQTKTETVTKGGPPWPTATQRFRNNPLDVHQTISQGLAQFWDLSIAAVRFIEAAHQQPMVLIIDGLEKMPLKAAERFFYDERRYVEDLPCRVLVTAPLAMSFEAFFGDVEDLFLQTVRLRALSHEKDSPGYAFLKQMAVSRGADEVLDEELIDEAVALSGGVPRQLLQLLAAAATKAAENGLSKIHRESLARARHRVTDRWQYQLSPDDMKALAIPDEKRSPAERARLLRLGALLEYDEPDGELRLSVNPLVVPLLERHTRKTADAA